MPGLNADQQFPTANQINPQIYNPFIGHPRARQWRVIPPQLQVRHGPIEWVVTTPEDAHTLTRRALVAGYEAHDNSPLWVIRARHEGDVIPGKLAIAHQSAYVPWGESEHVVHDIEVCCAPPDRVRWVESSNGRVPPNAVVGGATVDGEPLYVGRAKEQGSLTPGKVHQSHRTLYLSFAGMEVPHRSYEVLVSV